MEYNVEEYWIINPLLNTVQIYNMNNIGTYHLIDVVKNNGIAKSIVLEGFAVDIEELFKEN
ncbi:Uma2 family endonuclease [Ornithinibacillus halophilus]|uniref:Uma2 family endonuclease n=1 Tax=Ornithinibacillus halophilus TaxID=930117 RepID=UPI0009352517